MTRHSIILLICLLSADLSLAAKFPTNNNPANQIRFTTLAQAEARRDTLIHFIWADGLPATVPEVKENVEFPPMAVGIDPANVARVDQLDVNVSGWDFHSISYLLHPKNTANAARVVIVHQGHGHNLEAGVGSTANHMLANGFTVVIMKMPLYGWSKDNTAALPGQGKITYHSHDDMILNTGPKDSGLGFRLFLEPVVQVVNYVTGAVPHFQDVNMIGLSGGGWTTSIMSAIDKRLMLSVPVAGSAPLYRRNEDPGAVGDPEQYFIPLYNEDIHPDGTGGGAATWLEIYALGAIGQGRRQIQVTNEFDSCCFTGTFPDTYKTIVADKVANVGAGQWDYVRDTSHNVHQISNFVIANVIDPLFGIAHPVRMNGLPVVEDFTGLSRSIPKGWDLDPENSVGAAASASPDGITLRGPGMASIVRGAPFNPQRAAPITISLKINNISPGNAAGVFITDEAGPRPHQLGAFVNSTTKEIGINADNGHGFDSGDRLVLATLPSYTGGPALLRITYDTAGFSVDFNAGAAGRFASTKHPWSDIPNGFDPANLGDHTQLFIQSYALNPDKPASLNIHRVEVRESPNLNSAPRYESKP